MPASYVDKTVFWAKCEFVEDLPINKLGGCPKWTSSSQNVKVLHFFEIFLLNVAASAACLF